MLIDTHTHLDTFSDTEIAEILARAKDAGVGSVVSVGTTVESSAQAVRLSAVFPQIFAGVGVHPMDLRGPINDETYASLLKLATSSNKVLMISEIGLDFKEGMPDRAMQFQAFRQQIRLARELKKPIVFHSRDSHPDTLRVLREEQAYEVRGIMHYFQADAPTARKAIDLGFYISLAKPLLRVHSLQQVAARLPLDHIVLETDSTPQPFKTRRENWTEPRHLRDIAAKLAELQGKSMEEVKEVTSQNFLSVIGSGKDIFQRTLDMGARTLPSGAREQSQLPNS